MYKSVNQIKKVYNEDLLLVGEEETREIRGHRSKLRNRRFLNTIVNLCFSQRNVEAWNGI